MRYRYSRNKRGKLQKQAVVYSPDEHGISLKDIDNDAIRIIKRLKSNGYEAYIVGGAVRDLLHGQSPKDFDLVTDAYPAQIKKLFRNSRIIGRRFRLVHVYFKNNKIIEVATFRALTDNKDNNTYGTIDDDVKRRDFTLNALFYSPLNQTVIDYVHGLKDIKKKKLKSVISLKKTFIEDPVRMVRGIKYSVICDMQIPSDIHKKIKKQAYLLGDCSKSRLSEELFKILHTGKSLKIITECYSYGLLKFFLPEFHKQMSNENFRREFYDSLSTLDAKIQEDKEGTSRSHMLYHLIDPYIAMQNSFMQKVDRITLYKAIIKDSKASLLPLTAPNVEIEEAVKFMFQRNKIKLPKKRSGRRRYNRKGKKKVSGTQKQNDSSET